MAPMVVAYSPVATADEVVTFDAFRAQRGCLLGEPGGLRRHDFLHDAVPLVVSNPELATRRAPERVEAVQTPPVTAAQTAPFPTVPEPELAR
jgi:hypothetical protein